ncbi:MAG: tetratricopeptide repeat protein [Candidatus Hodarchaeota archaeon]
MDFHPKLKSKYFDENCNRRLIDEPVCEEKVFRDIQSTYSENLKKIVQICKSHSIKIIMVAPAGNYVNWQPSRSIRWRTLNDYETAKWENFYKKAIELKEQNKNQEALAYLTTCLNIDSTFAQVQYDYAEVLVRLGKFSEAQRAFKSAVDFDGAPKIASTVLINKMSEICNEYDIPFINVNEIFESQSLKNINDPKFFVDAHHLSWIGDLLIAKALRDVIIENFMISTNTSSENVIIPNDIELLHRLGLTRQDSVDFFIGRANWYLKVSEFRWNGERRLATAKENIDKALLLAPNNTKVLISHALWACLSNKPEIAMQHLHSARINNEELCLQIIRSPWVRHILQKIHIE